MPADGIADPSEGGHRDQIPGTDTATQGNTKGQTICRYIRDMKVVDFDSWGGDSGGIVFEPNNPVDAPTNLLGTHVHSQDGVFPDANRSWYSTTTKGFSELQSRGINIRPCQTAGC